MNVVQKIFEGQGRNQLISSGGQNDVTCCCTIQIHTFVKISGVQFPPLVAGLMKGLRRRQGGLKGLKPPHNN